MEIINLFLRNKIAFKTTKSKATAGIREQN